VNLLAALAAVGPKAKDFHDPLIAVMALYGIDTPLRVAHFLGQCAHESAGFTVLREGLNYTPQAILSTFNNKKITRFTREQAYLYGRTAAHKANQEMIANIAYANRMGNGPPESGDGWRTRGAGIIQLTGTNNLRHYSFQYCEDDRFLKDPNLLTIPSFACEFACLFWHDNNLNDVADKNDIDAVSDRINIGRDTVAHGDAIGFDHREKLTNQLLKILQ